ncbi:MAG: hypothetical protein IPI89_00105 [Propionivibrio sp.]|jgi:hypothetical protein|nr:hypothetical protein [Propionivibrio sp.]MBK7564111.1 hypothetical protein [Propionivibrio sp.]MBK9027544.1 hypothetical protein [Propionivibrio sp.]
MKVQDAYKEKMSAQLKVWDAQIKLLEAQATKVGADLKVKHAEEMRDLRDKQLAAAAKMKELDKATGEAWDQVKLTADKVWEDLKTGLSAAQSKFH